MSQFTNNILYLVSQLHFLIHSWSLHIYVCLKAPERQESSQMNTEILERLKALEKEMIYHKEESGKSKAEVNRLLEVLRELETERTEKDKIISELER